MGAQPTTMRACQDAGVSSFLVLDFDGVLNSFFRRGTFPAGMFWPVERTIVSALMDGVEYAFTLQYAPELVGRLGELCVRAEVQLVWLTSWQEDIRRVETELGIRCRRPSIVLTYPRDPYDPQAGKDLGLRTFQDGAAPGARVAWVDDDYLAPWRGPVDLTVARALPSQRREDVLVVCPDDRFGLSRAQWQAVEDWLGGGRGGTA